MLIFILERKQNKMLGHIHSIESFGTVDGPGVRMVIFTKGCPMRCRYCHNPDTWDPNGGTDISVEEILSKYNSKKSFYREGGITVSGGEPLLQMGFVTELLKAAKEQGIHTCVDTSGILFDKDNPDRIKEFDELVKYTDLFLLDIKHIDDDEHKKLTGHSNKNILDFTKYLEEKNVPVCIRHVVVPGITFNKEYLFELGKYIGTLKNLKSIDVLAYHDMGKSKYESLGIEYPLKDTPPLSKEDALKAKKIILQGIKITRSQK